MSLLARANRRHLLRQPLQLLLAVAGIGLGVAVVLAVELANSSALRAFELSRQAVSGTATDTIVAASAAIDEAFYRDLRLEHNFRHSAPRLEGSARYSQDLTLRVLGVDPLATAGAMIAGGSGSADIDAGRLIGTPNGVIVTAATARRLGVSAGDALPVSGAGGLMDLEIVSVLKADGAAVEGLRQVLLMDIATAQVLLDRLGELSAIDLELDEAGRRRLEALLPASLVLLGSESTSHAMKQMTRAFQINLTALSLLALLIGAFLIYNTQTLFVLNRREALAIWRTLGITRRQLMTRVLAEAAWMALAGCLVGSLAGIALSQLLLGLVTRTINDLYFSLQVAELAVEPAAVARACLLGLGAALASAALPALEASRVQPRLALSRSGAELTARRLRTGGMALGAGMGLVAVAILWLSERSVAAGFAGLFCIITGFAFLVPGGLQLITRAGAPALRSAFGWIGLWSARNVLASMSRTQVAVTALTIALAATIGVSVMIQSFRTTVVHWLDNYLRADVYISQADEGGRAVPAELPRRLRRLAGVDAVSTGRWRRLPTGDEPTTLFVLGVDAGGFDNFQLVNEPNRAAWPSFSADDAVIVSEAYAYHHRLQPGDTLTLPTEHGRREFRIIDLFYDYGSDRGRVVMHRDTYDRHWDDPAIDSLAVYLSPGMDSGSLIERLERGELRGSGLHARSNARIKELSLEIFDRTFTVTEVLRLLTIIVAGVGILGALVAIQLDRAREFAVLRAVGMTRGELSRVMMLEGGAMGAASAILAMPLGVLMAAVLIYVINKRSFGWSMQLELPWQQLPITLALGLAAGAAAALYPAWRMKRGQLAGDLRYE